MMNTQSISRSRRGRTKPQSRFQRLWTEAEELAQDNATLHSELDSLVQFIDTEVGRAENELAETVRQAVHRQLDFAEKKSLLKWQRAELSDWTDELLGELMNLGGIDETLRNRIAVLQARSMGVELDENSETTPIEQLREYMEQPDDDEYDDDYDDEGAPTDEEYLEDEEELAELLRQLHEQFGDTAEGASPDPHSDEKKKPKFDDTVFKRLFRQTAAALHPDKEINQDLKNKKHELMSELLRARKERDLITLVRLHEQHASAESVLSAADEQQLEEVLIVYLEQQHERTEAIVHRSPMHEWAYREFYHSNPATVKRRVTAHIKKIKTRRQGFEIFVTRVKTLKALKELLADRYEQHRYDDRWY